MIALLMVLLLAVVVVAISLLQRRRHLTQYMFFMRIPILIALTLLLLPFASITVFERFMGNMFVVQWRGMLIITWLAIFCSWMVMYHIGLLYGYIARRYELAFFKQKPIPPYENDPPDWFTRKWLFWPKRLVLSSLLAGSMVGVALWKSSDKLENFGGVIGGIVLAVVLRSLTMRSFRGLKAMWGRSTDYLESSSHVEAVAKAMKMPEMQKFVAQTVEETGALKKVRDVTRRVQSNLGESYSGFTPGRTVAFAALALVVYALGYRYLDPTALNRIAAYTPALAYVLLITLVIGAILPLLTMYFDRLRIPIALVLVLAFIVGYQWSNTDHYYDLMTLESTFTSPADSVALQPEGLLEAWHPSNASEPCPVMVVVTASGGGIAAAYWTALVLDSLGSDPEVGEQFLSSIVLVSAVSGGGVGAMYFADRYPESGVPAAEALNRAVEDAGTSSLAAMTWGLAYPDLLRAVGLFKRVNKMRDRGWALEQQWARGLDYPSATVGQWRNDIREGRWRPAVVFNATLAESGMRYLISPVEIPMPAGVPGVPPRRGGWTVHDLYPYGDIAVVTAARLSATFPYITPISRPDSTASEGDAYHVADGGYYDNFGVITALEFLDAAMQAFIDRGGRKVLLVQIRSSSDERVDAEPESGWLYELLGPATTVGKVRTSSQVARNDFEVGLFMRHWAERDTSWALEIRPVVFDRLGSGPLSWHLSESDKEDVEAAWDTPEIDEQRSNLKEFLLSAAITP